MMNRKIILFFVITASCLFIEKLGAEETIIQQEKIPFEKCLQVIKTSKDKLFIAPEIMDVPDKTRKAVFKLKDGTLTITCNSKQGTVTVSTNTD